MNTAAALQEHLETLVAAVLSIFDAADFLAAGAETRLFDGHEVMKAVKTNPKMATPAPKKEDRTAKGLNRK